MADITMCKGTLCAFKQSCYRYTAPVNEYRQSYFVILPFDAKAIDPLTGMLNDGATCEQYWDNRE